MQGMKWCPWVRAQSLRGVSLGVVWIFKISLRVRHLSSPAAWVLTVRLSFLSLMHPSNKTTQTTGTDGNQPRGNQIAFNLIHEIGIYQKQSSMYFQGTFQFFYDSFLSPTRSTFFSRTLNSSELPNQHLEQYILQRPACAHQFQRSVWRCKCCSTKSHLQRST